MLCHFRGLGLIGGYLRPNLENSRFFLTLPYKHFSWYRWAIFFASVWNFLHTSYNYHILLLKKLLNHIIYRFFSYLNSDLFKVAKNQVPQALYSQYLSCLGLSDKEDYLSKFIKNAISNSVSIRRNNIWIIKLDPIDTKILTELHTVDH